LQLVRRRFGIAYAKQSNSSNQVLSREGKESYKIQGSRVGRGGLVVTLLDPVCRPEEMKSAKEASEILNEMLANVNANDRHVSITN
jgi:hypothetical protein